jgi:hypothetical protein
VCMKDVYYKQRLERIMTRRVGIFVSYLVDELWKVTALMWKWWLVFPRSTTLRLNHGKMIR